MKLIIFAFAAITSMLFACSSSYKTISTSNNAAYNAPAPIKTTFTTQYPTAANVVWAPYDVTTVPIDWELIGWPALTSNDYMVTYNVGPDRFYSWYDANGNWIGSTYALQNNSILPSAVMNTVNAQFGGYTIDKVDKEMWKNQTAYELKMSQGDTKLKVLIDQNGNVLKQKTKSM
ncbi:MAG: hypothetical protein C4330_11810 [Chitinophagaceae bacterium]